MASVVGVAKSMGGLKGGSIAIMGYIDISSITSGLKEMSKNLKDSRSNTKEAQGDFVGLTDTLTGLLGPLGKIGGAVLGATVGLAAMGPAVAPALARMGVSFFQITRSLGESLQPAFENFADLMEGFVSWLNSDQGKGVLEGLNGILTSMGQGLEQVGKF